MVEDGKHGWRWHSMSFKRNPVYKSEMHNADVFYRDGKKGRQWYVQIYTNTSSGCSAFTMYHKSSRVVTRQAWLWFYVLSQFKDAHILPHNNYAGPFIKKWEKMASGRTRITPSHSWLMKRPTPKQLRLVKEFAQRLINAKTH